MFVPVRFHLWYGATCKQMGNECVINKYFSTNMQNANASQILNEIQTFVVNVLNSSLLLTEICWKVRLFGLMRLYTLCWYTRTHTLSTEHTIRNCFEKVFVSNITLNLRSFQLKFEILFYFSLCVCVGF